MTLGKVAAKAGVAIDTARKVLRDDPSVRPYIRERVIKAVQELDYHPNLVARALKEKSLSIIPISVLSLGEFYYGELASQLSRRLVEVGLEPALCFNHEHLMTMCRSFSTSGSIIACSADFDNIHDLSKRQKVVTIDSSLPTMPSVGNISINFAAAYRHLTETVVARKRKKIAVISQHYLRCIEQGWAVQKIPAVFTTLGDHGLDTVGPTSRYVFASSQEMGLWLDQHPRSIDAVFCENDLEASRTIGELAARGLKTPDDILVVGCDANCKLKGMWSVKLDTNYMAFEAVSILKALIDGDMVSQNPVYVPTLIDEFDNVIPMKDAI